MLFHPSFFFPELLRLPEPERAAALREAARAPLDVLELVGIAAGLVLVTALTRYSTADLSLAGRLASAATNFAVALPLLALAIAPFHIRRVRRGLRQVLRNRGAA